MSCSPVTAPRASRPGAGVCLLIAALMSFSFVSMTPRVAAAQEAEKTEVFGIEMEKRSAIGLAYLSAFLCTTIVWTEIWWEGMTTYITTDPPDDVTQARLLNDYAKEHKRLLLDASALGGGEAVRDVAMILRVKPSDLARGGAGMRRNRRALRAALAMAPGEARGEALQRVLTRAFGITSSVTSSKGGAR